MMREENHVFQGMRRDNHEIKQDAKFLWDAHNIRLTNREESTFLSITNEKGTSSSRVSLEGDYVGHCVLGEYLIVFTTKYPNETTAENYIYRIKKDSSNSYLNTILFKNSGAKSNSMWDPSSPIETLGIYETDLVQKVYWVDGKHQPRVINIVADKLKGITLSEATIPNVYPNGSLDFTQELNLNEDVSITREDGSGVFSPGIIQYAFSYYNKYGQESNIFYTSELLNISQSDRGGSPEEVSSNVFSITINKIQTNFQYLRIYSIHRTSLDAVPTVKIVTDIEIQNKTSITYIDTGRVGDIEDPTRLLYIGGESIIAGTLTQKNNTMFLGNIEILRKEVPQSIKDSLKTYVDSKKVTIGTRTIKLPIKEDSDSLYEYSSQLPKGNTSTFKVGDKYRLGMQFQYKDGKWSEPVWLGDYTVPRDSSNRPTIKNDTLTIPKMSVTLTDSVKEALTSEGYKKARALVVLPSVYERMTLAQGVLCPTVFSIKDRVSNTPFAQSSWFFRLMSSNTPGSEDITDGARVQYRHLQPLLSNSSRGAEIQNMKYYPFSSANVTAKKDRSTDINTFFVDQSIVTMHSPDIEFDNSTKQALNNKEFELSIVGLAQFTSNAGDISIDTSTPPPAPNDNGFFHKSFLTINQSGVDTGIVAGMFYKSHIIDDSENADQFYAYEATKSDWELNWLIYPWHRSGSLNNDCARPEGKGTRTAELKRKVISNIRVSKDNQWFSSPWSASQGDKKAGITSVSIFDSNEVSLIKIPIPKNSEIKAINYYGNVDSLVTTDLTYTFYVCPNKGVNLNNSGVITNPFTHKTLQNISDNYSLVGDYAAQLKDAKEPVRIKYKSTPHAVFAFNYLSNNSPVTLPSIGNLNTIDPSIKNIIPFWSNIKSDQVITGENVIEAKDQYVLYISGTPEQIEKSIILRLNTYGPWKEGDCVIATCSTRPSDNSEADLYEYTNGSWSKKQLSQEDVNSDTYYKYSNYYWKPRYNGSEYSLHLVENNSDTVYSITQSSINGTAKNASLYLAELRRKEEPDNMFGGNSPEALRSNQWIPAGKATSINQPIEFIYGDTYYQRYDCLKTYPFTNADENSVVEIASFMCETRVNIDGRYDRNRGQVSNLNMSPTNFNLLNPVYSQRDNFFNYRILDQDYYKQYIYENQITWSKEKQPGEAIDTWTNITLTNTLNMDGEKGDVTALRTWNENLLCFQEKAFSQIMFNSRVQIPTSDGVPVEISNGYKVDGSRLLSETIGCTNKWSIIPTTTGLYFIDSNTDSLYVYNGELNNISKERGMDWWIRQCHTNYPWTPVEQTNNSIRAFYDNKYGDIYLSPGRSTGSTLQKDALCYSEKLGQFTSFMSYGGLAAMFNFADGFYSLRGLNGTVKLYQNNVGPYNYFFGEHKGWDFSFIANDNPTYTKVFDTIDLRTDHYWTYGTTQLLNSYPMTFIKASNEYQSAEAVVDNKDMRRKFRVWRGNIPRNSGTRQRIRNTWAMITLGWKPNPDAYLPGDNEKKAIIHDVTVHYTV